MINMKVKRSIVTTLTFALLFFGAVVLPLPVQITLAQDAPAQPEDTSTNPATETNNEQQTEKGQRPDPASELQFATGAESIYKALKAIGGFFAWIGGLLFDISLSWFVLDMKGTAEWLGITTVITEIWRMIRDIFNLLFIFGIIWVGFRLILGVDESNAKKNLTNIIIAALLINFSLFAAQIVVDFANIVTSEMSDLLKSSNTSQTNTSTANKVLDREVTSISDSFVRALDSETILKGSSIAALQSVSGENELNWSTTETPDIDIGTALLMGIASAFTLTLIGYVLAAGAFLMFARFLYLMFLMMFSPVMFLGFVLPNFKNKSDQWWKILFGQALMGPAYLFMLYIALKVLQQLKMGADTSLIGYVMLSLITCGFVWAALVTAQSMSKTGVAMADNLVRDSGRRLRLATGSASFGLAAKLGRSQIGSRAYKYAESDAAREAANRAGWRGTLSRAKLGAARIASDSSFDARKVGGVSNKLGFGEGRKGGYKTTTEAVIKKEKDYVDNLGTISDDDVKVASLKTVADKTAEDIKRRRAEIGELEKSKKGQPPEQIIKIQAEIDSSRESLKGVEEDHSKQKEAVEKEKYRIQLGTEPTGRMFTQQKITSTKNDLKARLLEYAEESSQAVPDQTKLERIKSQIAVSKKELAMTEKIIRDESGGYAATTENVSFLKRVFLGRDKSQNEAAAEKIRDEYRKKIKTKDEKK